MGNTLVCPVMIAPPNAVKRVVFKKSGFRSLNLKNPIYFPGFYEIVSSNYDLILV